MKILQSKMKVLPLKDGDLGATRWEHTTRSEYAVRFQWNNGDIAIWDNRSTAHVAPTDIYETDFNRQLYRVTLVGEPFEAFAAGAPPSKSLKGEPIMGVEAELAAMARYKEGTESAKL